MTHKLNIVLLALLILVGGPFYWLLLNTTAGGDIRHPVTIAQLRRLAVTRPGQRPIDARYETLGRRLMMSDLLAAGSGLRPVPFVVRAYQLILPDGGVITIDRGLDRQAALAERLANYDPRAQATVETAVRAARMALILAPAVHHSGSRRVTAGSGAGLGGPAEQGTGPYSVARGVVVIPTPDVAPDERMVYVQLADGTELLLAGDIAPTRDAWAQERPPARIAMSYLGPRNREALARWLHTLSTLSAQAPQLQIVTGHDAYVPRGLTPGFIAPADQALRLPR